MKLLICDLDGVINGSSDARADLVPGIKTKSTFWAKWHKAHVREDLNMDMLPLLSMYKEQGFEIAYLTNRQRECWDTTAEQLEVFPVGRLFMRHMQDDTRRRSLRRAPCSKWSAMRTCRNWSSLKIARRTSRQFVGRAAIWSRKFTQ